MWPFECIGLDGRVYFHFDNWARFLAQKQREYPSPIDRHRFELTLIYPRLRLEEVFTPLGPVSHHDIHFHSNDWSTVFEVYPAHCFSADGDNSIKIIIEDGHINPWGQPVTVMSENPLDAFDNNYNNFVYFQERHWKILNAVDLTNMFYDEVRNLQISRIPLPAWSSN